LEIFDNDNFNFSKISLDDNGHIHIQIDKDFNNKVISAMIQKEVQNILNKCAKKPAAEKNLYDTNAKVTKILLNTEAALTKPSAYNPKYKLAQSPLPQMVVLWMQDLHWLKPRTQ
jgi:hypothetical protein